MRMNQLIEDTCNKLSEIADVLYRGDTRAGIAAMGLVISDLAAISDVIQDEEIKKRLVQEVLVPILQSMEDQDGVMLADLITYELLELLHTLED